MAKAVWNGVVIAESDDTIILEGNRYFPRESINEEFFADSPASSRCPWKGTASYFDVVVGDEVNAGAAWYYAAPNTAAADIKDHVAFWRGVKVEG